MEKLLALPLPRFSDRIGQASPRQAPIFRQRTFELVRDAIVHELATEESGLRLVEIRRRVEVRLGEPVASARFKDYVNDQAKGANPLLERLGYGMYRLRSRVEPSQTPYP
jgi:hypothetical protein